MEPAQLESLLEITDPSAEAWCDVFLRLISKRRRIKTPEKAKIVCHALLKKVEDIGCEDKYSVWKIISICIVNLWRDTISFRISDRFQIPENCHLPVSERGEFFGYMFFNGPTLYISFDEHAFTVSRVLDELESESSRHQTFRISSLLQLSLRKSEVKLLRLLLNYGYLHPMSISEAKEYAIDAITSCRRDAPHNLPGHDGTDEFWDEIRCQLLEPRKLTNFRGWPASPRGFKRTLLAAMCIPALLKEDRTTAEQYVQCLRLYFSAVADPFVQADELEELLRFYLSDASQDHIDVLVRGFKRLYPESQGPYVPRPLKHLCRCAIRRNLTHIQKVLPVMLDDLGVNDLSLKMYIMGDL